MMPRAVWDRALGDVARDILGRPSRRFRARICELGWRLADGRGEAPALLPALVEIVHAGSLIVDDIEDGSKIRRGAAAVHLAHGVPRTLNAGTWMYFWALDLVDRLPLPRATRGRIRDAVAGALYRGHLGQALDLSVSIARMPRALIYRTVATSTMLKTGALMELAAVTGALAAGASDDAVETLAQFGRRMGLGLQMLDDFGNLTAPAHPRRATRRRWKTFATTGRPGPGRTRRSIWTPPHFRSCRRAPVRSANAETPTARGPARWRRS